MTSRKLLICLAGIIDLVGTSIISVRSCPSVLRSNQIKKNQEIMLIIDTNYEIKGRGEGCKCENKFYSLWAGIFMNMNGMSQFYDSFI